jgi:hypothetical protein
MNFKQLIAMKHVFLFLLLLPALAFTQQGSPNIEAIKTALAAGDADALSKYFADNVAISIQDKEQNYARGKATDVVRGFFGSNKPRAFSQLHKGTSRENSDQYCIGNLSTAGGTYRVYLYLKVTGTAATIQQMRFDKE